MSTKTKKTTGKAKTVVVDPTYFSVGQLIKAILKKIFRRAK